MPNRRPPHKCPNCGHDFPCDFLPKLLPDGFHVACPYCSFLGIIAPTRTAEEQIEGDKRLALFRFPEHTERERLTTDNARMQRYFAAKRDLAEFKLLNCWGNHDGCTRCDGQNTCRQLEAEMEAIEKLTGRGV